MRSETIEKLKDEMRAAGYTTKAILPDDEFRRIEQMLNGQPHVVDTPDDEIRYIEGLVNVPLGHLRHFRITTGPDRHHCECGRATSALDIVGTALRRRIHPRSVIRDTMIGLQCVFEFADDGRQGECYHCGRPVVAFSYWTNKYMYA